MNTLSYLSFIAFALFANAVAAAPSSCDFSQWDGLLQSVHEHSGEFQVLRDQKTSIESSRATAGILPPANVSGQFYKGLDRIADGEIEASYLLVWEDRRKKDSRLRLVEQTLQGIDAEQSLTQAKLKLDLLVALNRMQQIGTEQAALQESRDTYKRLSSKLKGLPALSPEQQLTLSIFQMAEDESQTKLATLDGDKVPMQRTMGRLTGCKDPKVNFKVELPQKLSTPSGDALSPAQGVLQSEQKIAFAEQEQTTIAVERNIEFGPIFRLNREDEKTNVAAGVGFALPLGAENNRHVAREAQARYQAKASEIAFKLALIDSEKEQWTEQYRVAIESLRKRWDLNDLQNRHKTMESLFASGRINAALIIEGHRQILESLKARHALESMAFDAYWKVQFLSGQILEVKP